MIKIIVSKLTKPKAPESIEELLASGAKLQYVFPATDAQGKALSAEEVRERQLTAARRQIADHERTIAKAAGLRSIDELEANVAVYWAKVSEANKHWQLMIRRFNGGAVEMPAVEDAHRAYNAAQRAREPVEEEYNKVKAAEGARAEIERLQKEIQ